MALLSHSTATIVPANAAPRGTVTTALPILLSCTSALPRIDAHQGGAGYWPPNSATAMHGAIAQRFDGIELDLVLT